MFCFPASRQRGLTCNPGAAAKALMRHAVLGCHGRAKALCLPGRRQPSPPAGASLAVWSKGHCSGPFDWAGTSARPHPAPAWLPLPPPGFYDCHRCFRGCTFHACTRARRGCDQAARCAAALCVVQGRGLGTGVGACSQVACGHSGRQRGGIPCMTFGDARAADKAILGCARRGRRPGTLSITAWAAGMVAGGPEASLCAGQG